METFLFRKIASNEIDAVHAIYDEVFEWLKTKGIHQWVTPKSRSFFEDFRRKDRLYGLFADEDLAVFAALMPEKPPHWTGEADIANGVWVHRLALNPRFRGRQIGALMVQHLIVLAHGKGASHICLDAVEGAMPAYYAARGFQKRKTANVYYPNSGMLPIVFMDIKCAAADLAAGMRLRCGGYEEPKF